MNNTELIGYIAGSLGSISLLPQVIKSWRSKSTKDISILWSSINVVGQAFWIIYGVLVSSQPLIVMSSINLGLGFFVFILKIRHG